MKSDVRQKIRTHAVRLAIVFFTVVWSMLDSQKRMLVQTSMCIVEASVFLSFFLSFISLNYNNNNGYLERLTRTGPERLHIL